MIPSVTARSGVWLVMTLLLASAWPASAQGRRPFEDLGRYLHAGDTVFVVERTEGASVGIVSRVTPTEVLVSVSGQERKLTRDTVAWIERSPDPVWDGALVGAMSGLLIGLMSAGFGSPEAALLPLGSAEAAFLFVGGGVALGAALDAAERRKYLVYGRRPGGLSFMRRSLAVSGCGLVIPTCTAPRSPQARRRGGTRRGAGTTWRGSNGSFLTDLCTTRARRSPSAQ